MSEATAHFNVLLIALVAQALVAFLAVLLAQRVGIEFKV